MAHTYAHVAVTHLPLAATLPFPRVYGEMENEKAFNLFNKILGQVRFVQYNQEILIFFYWSLISRRVRQKQLLASWLIKLMLTL